MNTMTQMGVDLGVHEYTKKIGYLHHFLKLLICKGPKLIQIYGPKYIHTNKCFSSTQSPCRLSTDSDQVPWIKLS